MSTIDWLLAALLVMLGTSSHLWLTRYRAGLAVSGRPALALLFLPLGFLGPALAVYLASLQSKALAWCVAASLVVVHHAAVTWLKATSNRRTRQAGVE